MKRSALLFILGVLMSTTMGAEAKSPVAPEPEEMNEPEEIQLDERLKDLDYFARQWTCMRSTQGSSEMANPYQWTVTQELNDFWYLGRGETQSGVHTQQDTLGYNTIFKKFGRTILGNDSTFANFLSSGWNENQIVWVGTSSNLAIGQTAKHKIVMTKISEQAFTSEEYRVGEEPDSWEAIATQICAATDSDS